MPDRDDELWKMAKPASRDDVLWEAASGESPGGTTALREAIYGPPVLSGASRQPLRPTRNVWTELEAPATILGSGILAADQALTGGLVTEGARRVSGRTKAEVSGISERAREISPVAAGASETAGTIAGFAASPITKAVGAAAKGLPAVARGALSLGAASGASQVGREVVGDQEGGGGLAGRVGRATAEGAGAGALLAGAAPMLKSVMGKAVARLGAAPDGRLAGALVGAGESVVLGAAERAKSAVIGDPVHAPGPEDLGATLAFMLFGAVKKGGTGSALRRELEKREVKPERIAEIEAAVVSVMREEGQRGLVGVKPEVEAKLREVGVTDEALRVLKPEIAEAAKAPVEPSPIEPVLMAERFEGAPPEQIAASRAHDALEGKPIDPTSIKNRIVNRERQERGLGPMAEPLRQKWGEVTDKALDVVAENPLRAEELARELGTNPRPHTAVEGAILDIHRVNLHKARRSADLEGLAAASRGDADAVAAAKARATVANDAFLQLELASKQSGTETGRALAFRRAEMAQDYSLIAMETRRRAENDYKPLTEKQAAETKALHDQLAEAVAERDAHAARVAELEARREGARSRKAPPVATKYGEKNVVVTREVYETTKAALRAKLSGRLSAGIDPTLLADLAKMGAFHIEAGMRSFGKWSAKMREDFGDEVRPHLRALWDESRKTFRDPAALASLKTRAKSQAAEYERAVADKDFATPERIPVHRDAEAVRLEARMETAKKAWNEALFRDRLANRTLAQKASMIPVEAANTTRAVMTSADFSALLRQGGFIAIGNPVLALKAMPAMFRAFRSAEGQSRVEAEIALRPNYRPARQSGMFLSEHGNTSLSKMEEAYMSRWAGKIPLVAGSQRAYTAFLNRLRMDSFDAMVGNLSRGATPTPAEMKAVAHYINVATGRGGPAGVSNALTALNTVFFSPRLVASRFQLLAGTPMYGGTARTRVLVAKEYARFLTGLGVIYGLASLAGADLEADPRSSDFGKLRFGNTRLDPMTGLSQVTVVSSRALSGEKSKDGKITPLRGEGTRFGEDTSTVLGRFLRSKLAPVPSAGWDIAAGRDVIGQKVTLGGEAVGLVTPLAVRDIYKAMVDQGVPRGAALGLLSLFGMSLQVHDNEKSKR